MEFFKKKQNVVLIALLYTFLWGCAFPLVKICMEQFAITDNVSKCLVAGIRFFISGAALSLICIIKDKNKSAPIAKNQFPYILSYALLATSIQYAVTYVGLSNVEASKGAIFDQLCVFLIILSAGIFLKNDRLTIFKILGCIVGFIGILMVSQEKMSFTFALNGEGMMILAALCQTLAYFIAAKSANKIEAIKLVGFGQLIGGFILMFVALVLGGKFSKITVLGITILVILASISAIAYVLSLIPLKYFPASEISVFNLLITLFGMILSSLFLGENIFRINYLISFILISLGIILVNFKGKRKNGNNI